MTKEELYKAFIDVHKSGGQGTPAFIADMGGAEIKQYFDEFVEEGLATLEKSGSDYFYMPTIGYNVWKEPNAVDRLMCIRYFLGVFEEEPFLQIKKSDFEIGGRMFEWYDEWYLRNKIELEKIKELSDIYPN
jgi:hypothetical protein